MPLKLLFVCTGNTCRSPLAQGLARKVFADWDVEVHSAGIYAWEGDQASPHVLRILEEKGIDLKDHRARKLLPEWLEDADWVIPMTQEQERFLRERFPEHQAKIRRLGSWGGKNVEVSDPYGGNLDVYRRTAEAIEELLYAMKEELREMDAQEDRGDAASIERGIASHEETER